MFVIERIKVYLDCDRSLLYNPVPTKMKKIVNILNISMQLVSKVIQSQVTIFLSISVILFISLRVGIAIISESHEITVERKFSVSNLIQEENVFILNNSTFEPSSIRIILENHISKLVHGDYFLPWRFWLWFLVWTLAEYTMHRLCHIKSPYNPLWKLHRFHHSVPLADLTKKEHRWPKASYFLFWFENYKETIEILLGETIPAFIIYFIDPECGLPLLFFHYVYEILATDSLLEHNPDISQEEIVNVLAIGQFHLEHHRNPGVNFGFTITLWDHIFGTFKKPKVIL